MNSSNYFVYLISVISFSCILFLYFFWRSKKKVAFSNSDDSLAALDSEVIHDREPKDKAYGFQKYVVNMFDKPMFNILRWGSNGLVMNSIKGLKNPDLVFFAFNNGQRERFAIECKWRKRIFKMFGRIKWAEQIQVEHYIEFAETECIPIFIAFGVGGSPTDPEEIYLAKLNELGTAVVAVQVFNKFKLNGDIKECFINKVLEELFVNSYTGLTKLA